MILSSFVLNYRQHKISSAKRLRKQDCIPVGCVPPACCPYLPVCTVPGGVACLWSRAWGGCSWGDAYLWSQGVCSWGVPASGLGGVCSWGACIWSGEVPASVPGGGGCLPLFWGGDPLLTEFLTHASENITLPQLRCGREKSIV